MGFFFPIWLWDSAWRRAAGAPLSIPITNYSKELSLHGETKELMQLLMCRLASAKEEGTKLRTGNKQIPIDVFLGQIFSIGPWCAFSINARRGARSNFI